MFVDAVVASSASTAVRPRSASGTCRGECARRLGVGVVPIAGESLGSADVYGDDRIFVRLQVAGGPSDSQLDRLVAEFAGVASSLELFGLSKYVVVPLAALGLLSPAVAGLAMAMSSVSVVTNALLLARWSPRLGQRPD